MNVYCSFYLNEFLLVFPLISTVIVKPSHLCPASVMARSLYLVGILYGLFLDLQKCSWWILCSFCGQEIDTLLLMYYFKHQWHLHVILIGTGLFHSNAFQAYKQIENGRSHWKQIEHFQEKGMLFLLSCWKEAVVFSLLADLCSYLE